MKYALYEQGEYILFLCRFLVLYLLKSIQCLVVSTLLPHKRRLWGEALRDDPETAAKDTKCMLAERSNSPRQKCNTTART